MENNFFKYLLRNVIYIGLLTLNIFLVAFNYKMDNLVGMSVSLATTIFLIQVRKNFL